LILVSQNLSSWKTQSVVGTGTASLVWKRANTRFASALRSRWGSADGITPDSYRNLLARQS